MAVIRNIRQGPQRTRIHPSQTDALVTVVRPAGGGLYLQISTFGSDDRESEPKVSQTIQFDAAAAQELREIIDRTFGAR